MPSKISMNALPEYMTYTPTKALTTLSPHTKWKVIHVPRDVLILTRHTNYARPASNQVELSSSVDSPSVFLTDMMVYSFQLSKCLGSVSLTRSIRKLTGHI